MLACLVSFANEYHVFHCHAVIKKNSYGLVIISRYGVLKTVRTRGPYMHMCICACAHCFHATATNPPWHCAINWRFSSWLSRIFGEIMDPCRHILSTMWTLDTYNVYLYKKTQLPQLRATKKAKLSCRALIFTLREIASLQTNDFASHNEAASMKIHELCLLLAKT